MNEIYVAGSEADLLELDDQSNLTAALYRAWDAIRTLRDYACARRAGRDITLGNYIHDPWTASRASRE